jgi:hypothetical protein
MSLEVETFNNLREADCCFNCKFVSHKNWLNDALICKNEQTAVYETQASWICDLFEKGDLDD